MSSPWIAFVASVTYGFPSVFLYFLTSFIIIKHRKTFNSSFFNLYIYDGIMNVSTFTIGFFTMRLNSITCRQCFMAPFYENIGDYISLNFVFTMGVHMAFVQYSLTTLISLKRLSVLLNYNLLEPIWKKFAWLFVLLVYLAPFLSTHIVFDYEAQVFYIEASQCYSLLSPQLPVLNIYSVLIPFMVITILISVAANFTSILIVRNLKSQIKQKAETNFLVIMCITCAVQLIGTILTVALFTFILSPVLVIIGYALPFVSDGLSLVQPYLLICFSNAMRKQVKLTFGWEPHLLGNANRLIRIRSITN